MEKKNFTLETFERMIEKVVFWNKLGGNEVTDDSLIPVYQQLSQEEFFGKDEFLQGWFTGDKVTQADGTGDFIFVQGFLCELMQDTTIDLNDEEIGKLYPKTNLIVADLAHNIINGYEDYQGLYILCRKMSEIMDVEAVFNAVYESNMTKFVNKDELYHGFCLDGEIQHIEDQGRYADVTYKEVGDYYVFTAGRDVKSGVVFDKPKVIKPSTFKEVCDLSQFIY